MNKKIILFFSFLTLCLLLTSCFTNTDSVESETISEEEEVSEESALTEEDLEVNTESADVSRSTSREVVIENFLFNPSDVSISLGDTIEWINLDSVSHTVTFEDARFDVEVPAGSTVSYTFEDEDALGEARYFCQFHPSMQGSILVE